jgi:hypothetical protein
VFRSVTKKQQHKPGIGQNVTKQESTLWTVATEGAEMEYKMQQVTKLKVA